MPLFDNEVIVDEREGLEKAALGVKPPTRRRESERPTRQSEAADEVGDEWPD
jgi:hypothetical protein